MLYFLLPRLSGLALEKGSGPLATITFRGQGFVATPLPSAFVVIKFFRHAKQRLSNSKNHSFGGCAGTHPSAIIVYRSYEKGRM
jgi:hypothetical protein